MGFYLLDRPPARPQFLPYRRAAESGCVVLHTPEGGIDLAGADTKAEQVAEFIRTRSTPGSYHWIADSDSSVHMMPWTYEAAQDRTGSNKWAVGISIACDAAMWPKLLRDHPTWVDGALAQAALGACAYALDLHARTGIVIPARRIFRSESENGAAGFIAHGDRDPGRRSDPGPSFPFARFLEVYAYFARLNGLPVPAPGLPLVDPPPSEEDDMKTVFVQDRYTGWWAVNGLLRRHTSEERVNQFKSLGHDVISSGPSADLVLDTTTDIASIGGVDEETLAGKIVGLLDVDVDASVVTEAVKRALREGTS